MKHATFENYDENEDGTLPTYGQMLAAKIRAASDCTKVTDLEKFILDSGWGYTTKEALQAGYDRKHDILITEEEFVIEAGKHYEAQTLKTAYAVLSALVDQKKLSASAVYAYANYKWCLRNPEATIAYQRDGNIWEVNNCDTEITKEAARIKVCEEWGFEASRVRIVGTPHYDATDYQFIRFDCAHMTWLWKNGNLYQVYV